MTTTSLLVAAPAVAFAQGIISQSASVRLLPSSTPSVAPGVIESDTFVELLLEQQGLVLPASLAIDTTTTGLFDSTGSLTPGIIPAGTRVNSLYLYTDPATDGAPGIQFDATLTLDSDIIGVIVRDFDNSDLLVGFPGTAYGASNIRGLELGNDTVTISPDRRTITFHTNTVMQTDGLRVITATAAAPEPSSLILILPTIAALSMRRRNK